MKKFDFYEFAAILVPGSVVVLALTFAFPLLAQLLGERSVSVGEFGLVVLLSYVMGHLAQSLGNLLENAWWSLRAGRPTDWPRTGTRHLLSDASCARLEKALPSLGFPGRDLGSLSKRDWYTAIREMYALIGAAGRAGRVDVFNANYGLHRGLASAFLIVGFVAVARSTPWIAIPATLPLVALSLYRMDRFGRQYARELFVQYLALHSHTDQLN